MSNDWPKVTVETPVEEIHKIHQDIWDCVIKTNDKPSTPYISNCVLCEYAALLYLSLSTEQKSKTSSCNFCSAIWTSRPDSRCFDYGSPFVKWFAKWFPKSHPSYNAIKSKIAAEKVRNIPFKDNKKTGEENINER